MTSPTGAGAFSRALPLVMLITQGAIFGAVFSVNKIAITSGIPPIGYTFWQSAIAGVILLVVSALLRRLPAYGYAHVRMYFATGLLALAVPYVVLAYVAPKLPAGVVTLVITLIPAMTYLIALAFRAERFRWLSIGGLGLGVVGVLLVVLPKTSLPSPEMTSWVLVALIAPVVSALSNVVAERFRPPATSSLSMACGMLLAGAVILLPVMLITGNSYLFEAPSAGNQTLLIAILISSVNFILFFEIVRRAGAVFFSQFNYVAVLSGIVWGMVVFGESHSLWVWAALVLMFAGLAMVNTATRGPR